MNERNHQIRIKSGTGQKQPYEVEDDQQNTQNRIFPQILRLKEWNQF